MSRKTDLVEGTIIGVVILLTAGLIEGLLGSALVLVRVGTSGNT